MYKCCFERELLQVNVKNVIAITSFIPVTLLIVTVYKFKYKNNCEFYLFLVAGIKVVADLIE